MLPIRMFGTPKKLSNIWMFSASMNTSGAPNFNPIINIIIENTVMYMKRIRRLNISLLPRIAYNPILPKNPYMMNNC